MNPRIRIKVVILTATGMQAPGGIPGKFTQFYKNIRLLQEYP